MDTADIKKDLMILNKRITSCTLCTQQKLSVSKPQNTIYRGDGRKIMLVGIEPGNNELNSGQAFTGLAGQRLLNWLIQAGVGHDREEVFKNAYFTSLLKCKTNENGQIRKCYLNCQKFLFQQIDLIRPKVLITLGKDPLKYMFNYNIGLEHFVGKKFTETDLKGYNDLTPILDVQSIIIPLPHPSPLNRWLNEPSNSIKVAAALNHIKEQL